MISIHYPEFSYEEDIRNVEEAAVDLEVDYPIALDNDGLTWRAYKQRFWPTTYLIDKQGYIRYKHIGEFTRGSDQEADWAIRMLMAEPDPTG